MEFVDVCSERTLSMKPLHRQVEQRIPGGWLLCVLACFLAGCASGEQPPPRAAENAGPGPTRLYFGIAACSQCHTKPGELEPVLCRCTEATIWGTEDKHKDAFLVLRSERAKEMGELLHF